MALTKHHFVLKCFEGTFSVFYCCLKFRLLRLNTARERAIIHFNLDAHG